MRIAIIGAINFDSLEFHIHDELSFLGHDCKIFDFDNFFPPKVEWGFTLAFESYAVFKNKILLRNVLQFNPELVIVTYRNIHPFVVKEIKNNRIKIISLNPDALTQFQSQQLFVEPYDVYFSKDPYTVRFLKDNLKFNVFLYHEAFNSRFITNEINDYKRLEMELGIDVLSFGTFYPYRNRFLSLLKQKGVNLTLYGTKAKYFDSSLDNNLIKKKIYGDEKIKILNGSKIVFNNFHYAEIESVNNKFFEIFGYGAFQICDYRPILNEILPIDPRLVSFKNFDEAEKLIFHYLNNPEKRYEIRKMVSNHFKEFYSYKNLVLFILEKSV